MKLFYEKMFAHTYGFEQLLKLNIYKLLIIKLNNHFRIFVNYKYNYLWLQWIGFGLTTHY